MDTPWGPLRVFDAHVHFFSHRFYSLLAAQLGPAETAITVCAKLGWPLPPEDPEALAAQWDSEFAMHRIDRAVLIASLPGDEDSVARAVKAFPQRFSGYFMLNPVEPDAPERCAKALAAGLRGVALFPAMHRYPVNDDRVKPIFELSPPVVFVHCGVLTVGVREKLGLPCRFDLRFSNPLDLHPIALRYPHINFVVPHFGAGYFREALMLADLCPNVHLDTSSSNSWIKYEGLDLGGVFQRALAVAGPGRLLFGSDSSFMPRGWNRNVYDIQVKVMEECGVVTNAAAAILGENLYRLMRL